MPDVHHVRQDKGPHFFGLLQQRLTGHAALHGARQQQDQLRDFCRVVQRVVPALEGGPQKSLGALGLVLDLCLRGEQNVAVKVDAEVCSAHDGRQHTEVDELPGLHRGIGRHGIDPALDQVIEAPGLRQDVDAVHVDAFALKHRAQLDFPLATRQHDFFAHQVSRASNVAILAAEDHIGGVLKDGGHRHDRLTFDALDQQVGVTHCKLGPTGQHLCDRQDTAPARLDRDVQALGAVKAFGLRRVVTRKLELVQPFKL